MNAVLERAHLSVVTNEQRGAEIRRRRLRLGIKSAYQLAEESRIPRDTITKAENGKVSARSYERIEAWLEAREHELSSDHDDLRLNGNGNGAEPAPVTIKMSGVYGIEDVTISGPVENLDDLKALAVELMREVRERGD